MESLTGKTILITGATDGLGKQVAIRAAEVGATLLLHGRNPQKGDQLLDELKNETGNYQLHYYNADFASLAETRKLSEAILAEHSEINVMINNAAIGGGPKGSNVREVSTDGYELRFAVNYLAHFVLTHNLLPVLTFGGSRIVNISSVGQSPIDFNDLMMEQSYDSFTAYCRSKLAQIIWGFTLAEKLGAEKATVTSLHPATLMNTNMVRDFFGSVSSTIEEGADVVEHVAFSNDTEGVTGVYFNQKRQARANSQAYKDDAKRELWDRSMLMAKDYLL